MLHGGRNFTPGRATASSVCSPGVVCKPAEATRIMKRLSVGVVVAWLMLGGLAAAEPTLTQRVTQIDQTLQTNQQALAQYTWQQQEVITVNGAVKKQVVYQVTPVPGGLPQRTLVGRNNSRLSQDDEDYAQRITGLAEGYAEPQPGKLVQLLNLGNVVINPTDSPHVVKVDVQSYLKQGDDTTIVFDNAANQIQSIRVASYLTDQLSTVHINAQYAQLSEGVNHVATLRIDGLSNNLVITEQDLNYKKQT
jgi:hypothetical protein